MKKVLNYKKVPMTQKTKFICSWKASNKSGAKKCQKSKKVRKRIKNY